MRVLPSVCSLALTLATGCYVSHGRDAPRDGGRDTGLDATPDEPDARPGRDAAPDARTTCADGAACDDGDLCTAEDRCRAGVCAGLPITCESAPNTCFDAIGVCRDGECAYAPDDAASCDDADPCTTADACAAGSCAGTSIVCDAPPPSECVDSGTLRTFAARGVCGDGVCTYSPVLRTCPDGCVDGACRCVPTPWITNVVDERFHGDGGPSPDAIAIDRSGGIHAVYPLRYEGDTSHTVLYAHRPAGGAWQIETVGRGWFGAIGVDAAGTVHVVHLDEPMSALIHAMRGPGGWVGTPVPIAASGEFRMAVGGDGVVHLALHDSRGVFHASRSVSGAWAVGELDVSSTVRRLGAITVDARGGVHVTYAATGGTGELRYAHRRPGGSWVRSAFAAGDFDSTRMDIDVDPAGGVHVLYSVDTDPLSALVHAHLSDPAGAWALETVEEAGRLLFGSATMAIDERGVLHSAVHVSPGFERMRYVSRDPSSGAWSAEPLDAPSGGSFTFGSSIALDGHEVHIVFKTLHALLHASRRVCP